MSSTPVRADQAPPSRGLAVPPPAATLFGTSDPAIILRRVDELATALAQALEDRDLARKYGDSERHFIHIEGWQLVGTFLGVSARVTLTSRLQDGSGWEARAEAVTTDGRVIGAADGMCQRGEPGRRSSTEHAIRAMAQVRARRGALRSVLAFVPAIGGLDLADPDAPATRKQVVALHTLAGEHGWDHGEAHRRAGVESFNQLTREQAAELLEAWGGPAEPSAPAQTPQRAGESSDPPGPGDPFPYHPGNCPGHEMGPAPRAGWVVCRLCGRAERQVGEVE